MRHASPTPEALLLRFGRDILHSEGMQREKQYLQHGTVTTYRHSVGVALLCLRLAERLPFRVNTRALVRGALLHDYFLYDWHEPDKSHRLHAFHHAARAMRNAQRDFGLSRREQNMIHSHMFPLSLTLPHYRESLILCAADKLCAIRETLPGAARRAKI